jgi:hypothetical protein
MILVTLTPPRVGQVLNDGVERVRIVRVLSFTGTVARLQVEPVPSAE